MSRPRLPRPGGLSDGEVLRARALRALALSPMTGGELRRRFGQAGAERLVRDLPACGLVVRDEGGVYSLTPAGRIAARGREEARL